MIAAEQEMALRAKQRVLAIGPWLPQESLARYAQISTLHMTTQLKIWKDSRKIYSLLHEGTELFPRYAFSTLFQPVYELEPILMAFEGKKTNLAIACWFAGNNGYLGGKRPLDILETNPEDVLSAANDELAGITHG